MHDPDQKANRGTPDPDPGSCPDRVRIRNLFRIIKVSCFRSTPDPEYPYRAVGANAASTRGRKRESATARSRRPGTHYLSTGTTRRREQIGDSGEDVRRSTDPGRNDRRVPCPGTTDTGEGRRAPPQERNPGGRRGRPLAGALQRDADPEAVTRTAPRAARGRPADPGPDGQAEGVPRARGRVVRDVRPGRRARRDLLLPGEADLSGRQLLHDGAGRGAHRHRPARGRTRSGGTRAQPRPRMEARGPAHRLHGRPLHRRDPHRQQVGRALQVPAAHPAQTPDPQYPDNRSMRRLQDENRVEHQHRGDRNGLRP